MLQNPISGIDSIGLVDLNLIPKGETLHIRANGLNYNNIFTVASHGYGGLLLTEPFTPLAEIAKLARESGKSEMMLIACNQGGEQDEYYGNSAQALADLSGLPVQYSGHEVRIIPYLSIPFSFDLPWRSPWRYAYPRK